MISSNSFCPSPFFRNAYVQTVLASSKIRTWGGNAMVEAAREIILEAGGGVRLLGLYSPQVDKPAKGLVILLHGWEGSVDSTYVLRTGKYLYHQGYDVFRLNFRDHGQSHHLNEGVFFAIVLDEVFYSVKGAASLGGRGPVFLAGFSLGGNFALRIALKCHGEPIENLRHVVAISPVLHANKTADLVDKTFFIRNYFLRKWRRSLLKKQELFPDKYDFTELVTLKTIRGMTGGLLRKCSDYNSTRDYFMGYSLLGEALKDLPIPTTIITSEDDPMIAAGEFYELKTNDMTNVAVQRYGGHNGFIEGFSFNGWYEQELVELFDDIASRE